MFDTTGRDLPVDELNQRRLEAVRLRLAGKTVAETAKRCGLTAPTVIAAMKAFSTGGWEAVPVKTRGRSLGSGGLLSGHDAIKIIEALTRPEKQLHSDLQLQAWIVKHLSIKPTIRTLRRYLTQWGIFGAPDSGKVLHPGTEAWLAIPHEIRIKTPSSTKAYRLLVARDRRNRLFWASLHQPLASALDDLASCISPPGESTAPCCCLGGYDAEHANGTLPKHWQIRFLPRPATVCELDPAIGAAPASFPAAVTDRPGADRTSSPLTNHSDKTMPATSKTAMTHLQRLEAESIHIFREVVAEAANPVMLYSIGKDSAVMLHLARKAFFPARPPFPLLHVDTRWKFREMYTFRDHMARESGMDLLIHVNPEGIEKDINPFTHGSSIHTDIMKTEGLKQALEKYGFDVAFGGARRDEEKSRAKERIFSFRNRHQHWDPKNQRPELWKLYNVRKHQGESIRVFPLSNWTELDIWQYIHLENIPIVPLYFSQTRPVVERNGMLIMVDDHRMPLQPGEVPMMKQVRFRTLGCYPLTGAIESTAHTLPEIIQEMLLTRTSERQGRVIDHDGAGSMEKKKQEGYF